MSESQDICAATTSSDKHRAAQRAQQFQQKQHNETSVFARQQQQAAGRHTQPASLTTHIKTVSLTEDAADLRVFFSGCVLDVAAHCASHPAQPRENRIMPNSPTAPQIPV